MIDGDASGGTAYIDVTAEQEPEETYAIRVYSVINEDHETATGAWGGYNGQEMMWIPQEFPLGNTGQLLDFTGPYPQTISVSGTYSLDPITQPFNNLSVATFVQYASGTRECLNANYMDLPDTSTGVHGDGTQYPQTPILTAGPNPSSGFVTVECLMPSAQTGTVRIFDTAGRVVESFPAGASTSTQLDETGVYFVVLNTSSGDVLRERLTVIE
ncbi:MAG: T9SS type A sorting domain-containing protein [Candidatus Aegiribacteria sp.]|nr:T9SS type A sorting domain-containing protein [Candidatus Aegiribacteria sp.]